MRATGAFGGAQQMPRSVFSSPAFFYWLLLSVSTYKFCPPAVPEATVEALTAQIAALQGIITFRLLCIFL
jgi:hypothetical protein